MRSAAECAWLWDRLISQVRIVTAQMVSYVSRSGKNHQKLRSLSGDRMRRAVLIADWGRGRGHWVGIMVTIYNGPCLRYRLSKAMPGNGR